VRGYIFNLEVTYNALANTWHPHMHIIYDGQFWPWQAAKSTWQAILSKRGIVGDAKLGATYTSPADRGRSKGRVDSLASLSSLLREICKYTLKPFESTAASPQLIVGLHHALLNMRLHGTDVTGTLSAPPDRSTHGHHYLSSLGRALDDPTSPVWTDSQFGAHLVGHVSARPDLLPGVLSQYPILCHALAAHKRDDKSPPSLND